MKRKIALAVGVLVVLSFTFSFLGYYWYLHSQVDLSWIEPANNLLRNYKAYPNETQYTNPEVTLSARNMYLVENGSEQLIYYGNGDTLSLYLGDLLKEANMQKGPVSEDYLSKVLANDKVVTLRYRSSILHIIDSETKYYTGYFILEDNLNDSLKGTIIAREIAVSLVLWKSKEQVVYSSQRYTFFFFFNFSKPQL